ncbi:MAG: class I SAM-dependent methyltransferase [candidate division WOR-3 bacterium]
MAKKYTAIETWIVQEVKPVESNSAEQTYERLEKTPGNLPVIDLPQNLNDEAHFIEEAQIGDFALRLAGAQKVLDVGCGDGWPLLRLAPLFDSVTGIDASSRRVARATANAERLQLKNVTIKQMSMTEMNFPDNSFDGVVAASAVEQTPDPYQALREIFRVLKPGGKFQIYFEAYDGEEKGVSERVFITENEDCYGYHYVLKHQMPPWERNYLVKFSPTPEMQEEFRRLSNLIERLGSVPAQAPEIGLEFLERNQKYIIGGSWYELEHFTTKAMKETLEEIGFSEVRISYSAATFARHFFKEINPAGLTETQLKTIVIALANLAVGIDAPAGQGEPIITIKPK